jgi:GTP cyclohydrolase II
LTRLARGPIFGARVKTAVGRPSTVTTRKTKSSSLTSILATDSVSEGALPTLEALAHAPLPTKFGTFELHVFRWRDSGAHPGLSDEHIALVMGDVAGRSRVPVRVHSECLTSEVFGSMKCDCREQLIRAQAEIARRGLGLLLYLRQEGRGIGLANKVRAYALQAQGADTVQANQLLHLPIDARQYDVAAAILGWFGVGSVQLMTNNPDKVQQLERLGIRVEGRIPLLIQANPYSAHYLEVKRRVLHHELPDLAADQAAFTGKSPDATH